MGTKKVLLDPSVNSAIWGNGIKSVPHRIRVRLHRRRNDNDDAPADEKLYTQVSVVNVTEFKVRPPASAASKSCTPPSSD
jgi:large subunit ribosomal protein L31e